MEGGDATAFVVPGQYGMSPKRVNTFLSVRGNLLQPIQRFIAAMQETRRKLLQHRHLGNQTIAANLADSAPQLFADSLFQRITSSRISPKVRVGLNPSVSLSLVTMGTRRRTSSKSAP